MSKIVVEQKKGIIKIVNRLAFPEALNERVFHTISAGMHAGILPVEIQENRKDVRLECVARGLVPVKQYFDCPVTKKMFLDFVYRIARVILDCQKNMINANNLDLQSDRIFIDPQSKAVMCVYWPVVNNQNSRQPHLYLKQLTSQFCFYPDEDQSYLDTYYSFFNGIDPFSVKNFEKMLLRLMGKEDTGHPASSGEQAVDPSQSRKATSQLEYDPFAQLDQRAAAERKPPKPEQCVCACCGQINAMTANFCDRCGAKLVKYPVHPGSEASAAASRSFPALVRIKTGAVSLIGKPVFKLGSDPKTCDLVVDNNYFISRNHADILCKNNRYYIIDRNSTNKTFVDGNIIPAQVEIEIASGSKIHLADEGFTFVLKS